MQHVRDINLLSKIAFVLKELREEKGVSQIVVFNETNVNIGRIETAKINPRVSSLAVLCSYFGISLSDFFSRVDAR